MTIPLLHIRVRESKPGKNLDMLTQPKIAEVFNDDGVCVGQLPFTKVGYEIFPDKMSVLTLSFLGGGIEMKALP